MWLHIHGVRVSLSTTKTGSQVLHAPPSTLPSALAHSVSCAFTPHPTQYLTIFEARLVPRRRV